MDISWLYEALNNIYISIAKKLKQRYDAVIYLLGMRFASGLIDEKVGSLPAT